MGESLSPMREDAGLISAIRFKTNEHIINALNVKEAWVTYTYSLNTCDADVTSFNVK